MNNVFFKPWVGCDYGGDNSLFQHKILVLGDSHYCEEHCFQCGSQEKRELCSGFTTEVVNDYLNPDISARWKSTFTTFMNSFVADTKHDEQSRIGLWNSVAFYNYLQIAAGTDARQTQHYNYEDPKYKSALIEVINELQPDIIISWGNKAWDAVPEDLGFGKYRVSQQFGNCCCIYPYKDKEIQLIGVTHPSTAYKSSYWSNVFCELRANH
ncbi:hypothetical protein [Vibrio parahaemolyticus]|uniref:hypothetical protein n=1 Tax=Vibrio parahaemolyticus TaxID=670 RepID=UPI0023608F6A|nr:hypothetical protein [Vibrio parahaemolyticus]